MVRLALWLAALASAPHLATARVDVATMKDGWKSSDLNGDGFVDFDEMVKARSKMGHKDAEKSAKKVMDRWDIDKDGKITVEEYLDYNRPNWRDEL
mmetsp:Transcript_39169/g.101294  ORF Transcript_39169/g.101294 Transcript_39169/m.101294 type:complete len:96 (-) Transcript_39169:49-336(-)